jgi:hypothetical protein
VLGGRTAACCCKMLLGRALALAGAAAGAIRTAGAPVSTAASAATPVRLPVLPLPWPASLLPDLVRRLPDDPPAAALLSSVLPLCNLMLSPGVGVAGTAVLRALLLPKAPDCIRVLRLMLWVMLATGRALLLLDAEPFLEPRWEDVGLGFCGRRLSEGLLEGEAPPGVSAGVKAACVAADTAAAAANGDLMPPGPTGFGERWPLRCWVATL